MNELSELIQKYNNSLNDSDFLNEFEREEFIERAGIICQKFVNEISKIPTKIARKYVDELDTEEIAEFLFITGIANITGDERSKLYNSLITKTTAKRSYSRVLENNRFSDDYSPSEPMYAVVTQKREEKYQRFLTFYRLIQKNLLPPAITVYSLMLFLKGNSIILPDAEEQISKYMISYIEQCLDVDLLEELVVCWSAIMPDVSRRKLARLHYDATNQIARENAKRALFLISKNPLEIIEGDKVMSETYHITGNSGIINLKSDLQKTTQVLYNSANFDSSTKDELETLIKRLNEELEQVPEDRLKDAEVVAKRAKMLVEAADEKQPDKELVKITADSLLKAAKNIAKVVPVVVPIAKQIISLLLS